MSLRQGNTIFSSLDLLSWYWQVPMAAESRESTAFSTPNSHFEWLRMPFGLKTAPIIFQRIVNPLFSDVIGKGVYAYLDDFFFFFFFFFTSRPVAPIGFLHGPGGLP